MANAVTPPATAMRLSSIESSRSWLMAYPSSQPLTNVSVPATMPSSTISAWTAM